jgi:hypothetical protein
MEAEGDDFRVDPEKIDFEEIQDKIRSLDPNIPLSVSYDFGSMPKFTRDRTAKYTTTKHGCTSYKHTTTSDDTTSATEHRPSASTTIC